MIFDEQKIDSLNSSFVFFSSMEKDRRYVIGSWIPDEYVVEDTIQ